MNIHFITGTSSGIGLALSKNLLSKGDIIYGFSRRSSIENENYRHTYIDLSDIESLKSFQFPSIQKADLITLVNNAGTIGNITPIGKKENKDIIKEYNLNIIAPSILINQFIKQFGATDCKLKIINISSGAAVADIDGWATYCSGKSALDRLSTNIDNEFKIHNNNIKIHSIAPGVVDTEMQTEIRKSKKEDFSNIKKFIQYKENNDLIDPRVCSNYLSDILSDDIVENRVLFSLREYY